ncbi:MAG: phosphotransferase, partial [Actinomycetota bacterium]
MHDGQVNIDTTLIHALLADQLPELAALPVREVASGGTENAIFRLGDDLAVRLPLHEAAVPNLRKEARWLPVVTVDLTLDVPTLVATGSPGHGYPFPWAVLGWVDGAPAAVGDADALPDTGSVLGRLVTELRAVDTAGAPA